MRIRVWLFPLEQERKGYMSSFGGKSQPDVSNFHHQSFCFKLTRRTKAVGSLLRIAWNEDPRLALQIAARFPTQKIRNDVRWLLLNFPEQAMDVPESLEVMLGSTLPSDISFQLKVRVPLVLIFPPRKRLGLT
jgi:phosphatidylinositol 4-kinase